MYQLIAKTHGAGRYGEFSALSMDDYPFAVPYSVRKNCRMPEETIKDRIRQRLKALDLSMREASKLFSLPLAGACWFAGLFCGLAAFIDSAAERREAEMAFRLIYGDARGLTVPKDLRQPPPRVEPRP